jgi:hypothetical protein
LTAAAWLEAEGAQHDLVSWAASFGDDWAGLWEACPRGDWLLAMAVRRGVPEGARVRAAVRCARLALDVLPDGETRAADGLATVEGGADARSAAIAALEEAGEAAPDPAVQAAFMAVEAALRSVDDPDSAVVAAASAIQATVLDTGECAMMTALTYAQRTSADRVREVIPASLIA